MRFSIEIRSKDSRTESLLLQEQNICILLDKYSKNLQDTPPRKRPPTGAQSDPDFRHRQKSGHDLQLAKLKFENLHIFFSDKIVQ